MVAKVAPVIDGISNAIDFITPHALQLIATLDKAYDQIQPYSPELLAPMLLGLTLIFFGGSFLLTISVFEAYRACGWTQSVDAFKTLWSSWLVIKEANEKDNKIDADNDGTADVDQIGGKELISRKITLFFKKCDPHQIEDALSAIYTGFMAVLAVLKMQFARTIALGASIGDILLKYGSKRLREPLLELVPKEYHKWIDTFLGYVFKFSGVFIAWWFVRFTAALHAAMRGANIFLEALIVYAKKYNFEIPGDGAFNEALSGALVAFGFYWQFSYGFDLPWFLDLLLWPVTLFEYALTFIVSSY